MFNNKKIKLLILIICFFKFKKIVKGVPVSYDQRQTGDVNVQLDVKNVKVVALVNKELLDDYVEYDYAYDYADFTIKPIVKPTSSSPLSGNSTTIAPWITWPTHPPAPSSTTTTTSSNINENSNSTILPIEIFNSTETIIDNINSTQSTIENVNSTTSNNKHSILLTENTMTRKNNKNLPCRDGYHKNFNGRCRKNSKRRLSLLPWSLKLAPRDPQVPLEF